MTDQEFLESPLNLGNGWIYSLLRIGFSEWSLRCRLRCRLDGGLKLGLLLSGADLARLLVLDGSRLWSDRFLVLDGDPETKLELGLCSTIELLIDGCVIRVENYEGCRAVGVAFVDCLRGRWECKEETKLCAEHHVNIMSTFKMMARLNHILNKQIRLRASFGASGIATYLIGKSGGSEVTERKLESSVCTLNINLKCDKSVGVCR